MMKYLVALSLLLCFSQARAQIVDPASEDEMFTISTPLTIDLDDEEEEEDFVKPKKKKRKRKVFYGLKTKKRFTREGFGDKTTFELFYVLKDPVETDPYLQNQIHWLDYRRGDIRVGGKFDPKFGAILHGPYTKKQGEQILEEGIYFKGLKHGRWVRYDKNDLLVDKEKYHKGWPKESMVSYYDRDRSQMKEVIPIEYGEKEGNYFYFHDNGRVAVKGEFKWDQRIGEWVEYYPTGRRKKVIRYDKEPFEEEFRPYIWKEWNDRGKLVYEDRSSR